jgi:hypothetical protein
VAGVAVQIEVVRGMERTAAPGGGGGGGAEGSSESGGEGDGSGTTGGGDDLGRDGVGAPSRPAWEQAEILAMLESREMMVLAKVTGMM